MTKKLHSVFIDSSGVSRYLCNSGFAVKRKRTAKTWSDVDCRNCLRCREYYKKQMENKDDGNKN
jgi:hypothetical protein